MLWIVSIIVTGLMTISSGQTPSFNARQNQLLPAALAEKVSVNIVDLPTEAARQQNRIDQSYPLNPGGRISLNNVNGAVVIEAWDKSEVRVEAVKNIDCDKPYQIDVNIDANPNLLQIETEFQREGSNRSWSNNRCREARVDYKLTVPRSARLDTIETVNGNITLSGMTDFVKASTVNGRINASNLRGTINLSSVNGTLTADFDSLENVRDVKMGMVNGKIDLQLPSDIEATLKADTVNGSISNEFGLPVHKGEYVGRNLYGRLGNGGISVKLDGVNGTINIRRKQDGRNPKQVTNLLPAKGEDSDNDDDEDKDDDNDAVIPRPPNGTAVRAPRAPRAPRPSSLPREAVIVPEIAMPPGELIDEDTRQEIRKSVAEATKAAAKFKIDQKELNRQIRESLEEARQEMTEAREFSWNNNSESAPMAERESKTLMVEGTPKVTVDARGGTVSIRGWERAEVSYSIGRQAANEDESEKASVTFEKKGSDVNIIVPKNAANYRLEIYVPRNCHLRVTSSRQIRLEGVKGKVNLDGGEEAVDVRDSSGDLSIRTGDGRVRVIGFDGTTEVKTLNGDIALEGDFSALDTDTAGGTTSLTISDNAVAEIMSSIKNVSFDGLNVSASPTTGDAATNVWQIGGKNAGTRKYSLKSGDGKIFVRSLNRVRVTRSKAAWFCAGGEISS